uniref:Uncharacterized protein n=1 Tax=Tetraselmis sp. GSL018 TaxID=582737 RepID=A0A061RL69_9CHLO
MRAINIGARAYHMRLVHTQEARTTSNVTVFASGGNNGKRRQRQRKARTPGFFEVKVITPPPRSLGIHSLEPNTGCGDEVEVDGDTFVVSSVVLQYKLQRGKYVRDHNRLEVQPTSRYFVNRFLQDVFENSSVRKS